MTVPVTIHDIEICLKNYQSNYLIQGLKWLAGYQEHPFVIGLRDIADTHQRSGSDTLSAPHFAQLIQLMLTHRNDDAIQTSYRFLRNLFGKFMGIAIVLDEEEALVEYLPLLYQQYAQHTFGYDERWIENLLGLLNALNMNLSPDMVKWAIRVADHSLGLGVSLTPETVARELATVASLPLNWFQIVTQGEPRTTLALTHHLCALLPHFTELQKLHTFEYMGAHRFPYSFGNAVALAIDAELDLPQWIEALKDAPRPEEAVQVFCKLRLGDRSTFLVEWLAASNSPNELMAIYRELNTVLNLELSVITKLMKVLTRPDFDLYSLLETIKLLKLRKMLTSDSFLDYANRGYPEAPIQLLRKIIVHLPQTDYFHALLAYTGDFDKLQSACVDAITHQFFGNVVFNLLLQAKNPVNMVSLMRNLHSEKLLGKETLPIIAVEYPDNHLVITRLLQAREKKDLHNTFLMEFKQILEDKKYRIEHPTAIAELSIFKHYPQEASPDVALTTNTQNRM